MLSCTNISGIHAKHINDQRSLRIKATFNCEVIHASMPKKPVGNLANIGHPCINAQETGWQSGKYRSAMHPCSRNWLATGQLFSAGIKCRHCSLLFSTYHKPLVESVVLCPPVASVQCRVVGEGGHFCCGDITILAGCAQTHRGAAAIFLLLLLHKSHGTI